MRRKGSIIASEIVKDWSKEEYFKKYIEFKNRKDGNNGKSNTCNNKSGNK